MVMVTGQPGVLAAPFRSDYRALPKHRYVRRALEDISGLPLFTLWCTKGPLAGTTFQVTDIGRAAITGQCADVGKLKGRILIGLAARAPYFHNGSAVTLSDVVEFYDQRVCIGLTDQQKSDLAAFLDTL